MSAPGRRSRRLTSPSLPLAGVVLVADLLTLAFQGPARRGDAAWLVDTLGAVVWALVPLLLVSAAVITFVQTPVGREEHLRPPPWAVWCRGPGAALLPAGIHALALVGAVTVPWAAGSPIAQWLVVAAAHQPLAIMLAVLLGSALGRMSRHPAVVVLAAVLSLLVIVPGSRTLRLAAGDSPYVGLARGGGEPLALVSLAAAVALAAAAGLGRGRSAVVAALASMVVVLGAAWVLPPLGVTRVDPAPAAQCDRGRVVEVCLLPGYGFMGPSTRAAVDTFIHAAAARGVVLPVHRIEQRVPGAGRTADGVGRQYFTEADLAAGAISPRAAVEAIVEPGWCPEMYDSTKPPSGDDAAVSEAWLLHESGNLTAAAFAGATPQLAALEPRAQARAVHAALARLAECEGL